MILSLRLVGAKRALLRSWLERYRNTCVVIGASVLAVALTLHLMAPGAAPNLADPDNAVRVEALAQRWAQGDVVALVRHVERCDRSTTACLGPADGVTVRGEVAAQQLGQDFRQLGLNNADVFSSMLTRARQTADAMFTRQVEAKDWLFNCRGTMLRDVLEHKVPGRNLVLVTHSECMDQLETDLQVPTDTPLAFGSTMFVTVAHAGAHPQMLGYIEPKDWSSILPASTALDTHRRNTPPM